jgi:hypothetical protein
MAYVWLGFRNTGYDQVLISLQVEFFNYQKSGTEKPQAKITLTGNGLRLQITREVRIVCNWYVCFLLQSHSAILLHRLYYAS